MCKWEPPQVEFLKLNVDGAIFFNLEKTGIGIILQDSRGKPLFAASIDKILVAQPESIYALSILRGLQLYIHPGIFHLIVVSDCLLVVEDILNQEPSNLTFGNIILDIEELMTLL